MDKSLKPFSLLIKPASADCNLNCNYCFYSKKASLYPESKVHRMPDTILDKLIESYMNLDLESYVFGWQGGEPTLMGLDFFKKVTDLQKKYGRSGAVVSNGLQTNATLLNDEFAKHLSDYNFLVGVSLDGPIYIHDYYRKFYDGRGSFKNVIDNMESLKRHNVSFNILTLINNVNVSNSKELYLFLKQKGYFYQQYIPCVEFDSGGNLESFSVKAKEWGNFLCELFDCWYPDDINKVSIRLFDSILYYLIKGKYNSCDMDRKCLSYFVVEYNGDVYPCDFFVQKDLRLGNVMENSWQEIISSQKYILFGELKERFNSVCKDCIYLIFCNGDCLKYRPGILENSQKLSFLCKGWTKFYDYTIERFKDIAKVYSSKQD